MATQKDKQRARTLQWLAEQVASPMTGEARVALIRDKYQCSRRQAEVMLRRTRQILRRRHEATADAEAFEQVERLRQLAAEARASGDYQAQIQAEKLIADVVGTKKAEKKEVQVSVLSDLVALADAADRERGR